MTRGAGADVRRALIGADLDRTLIYSRAAAGDGAGGLVAVERYRDADASWMTARAHGRLAALAERAHVVPVTTRTPEQLARVRLPGPQRFAICANGGVLLVDGRPDPAWAAVVGAAVAQVAPLAEVLDHVRESLRPEWTTNVREAHGLFCYAVVERELLPASFVAEAAAWARTRGWVVSLQGRKLYWVPATLTKSSALAEVARRVGAQCTLAAGDSLLDADLLTGAHAAIAARHGELVAAGAVPPGVAVTRACGAAAGEEIVDWLSARA